MRSSADVSSKFTLGYQNSSTLRPTPTRRQPPRQMGRRKSRRISNVGHHFNGDKWVFAVTIGIVTHNPMDTVSPRDIAAGLFSCAGAASINVRIRPQVLQNLLPLLFVDQQINPLPVVPALQSSLRPVEKRQELLPVHRAARPTDFLKLLLLGRSEPFQQLIFQRKEELLTAGVALAGATTREFAVHAPRLLAFRAHDPPATGL